MIPQDIQLMIDKICRSCMCESGEMHNVFEKTTGLEDAAMLLSDMLMACASVEVMVDDGLPYLLCEVCEGKLSSAFEFKQQCEKSDSALRELTNQPDSKSSKEEDIVVQPDVHEELYDEDEDDMPLVKRKRGRPSKSDLPGDLTCKYCMKVLHTRKGLRVHMRQHTGDGMRYCPICPSKYTRTNHLMRHMKSHDRQGKKHLCKFCSERFSLTSDLFKHIKIHLEETEKKNKKPEKDTGKDGFKIEVKLEKKDNIDGNVDLESKGESQDDTDDQKVDIKEKILSQNDDLDSMDIPLNQFPFSDDDDNDVGFANDDDDDFVLASEKKTKRKRGRPPKNELTCMYECKECNKVLTTYVGLRIHMRRHTGSDMSNCKLCDKTFTKKSHLNRHLRTHGIFKPKVAKVKTDKKVRECEFCDRKFKYRKSFVHHMQLEHGMSDVESEGEKTSQADEDIKLGISNGEIGENNENANNQNNGESVDPNNKHEDSENPNAEEDGFNITDLDDLVKKRKQKVHTCHVCDAQFARANHLTRHMTLHRAVLTHKCDRCDQAFYSDELLQKHIEEQHINKPYVCTTCNKPFSRGEHLIRHLKVHQSSNEQTEHKCSICEAVFSRSDHLARHTKTHLMQDKRHVCIECGKAFNRLDNLKTHQRIHTGVKDTSKLHLCVYCGKEFNNSSNMIVHMRRHTGERPYKCNECGKGFPRSHDLKCHERTHSGEKPYLCTLCGKSFNKSNKLLRHSRVHTGERPYVCNICGRAFTQSNDLALHMRRHTGARPYACGVCPARFIQSGQLKNHRRTTGHWMETQPDLKGGHRVEPVTPMMEPVPIKFKTFGKPKTEKIDEEMLQQQQQLRVEPQQQIAHLQTQPQRILMGIMGNIKIQNEVQPLIIDSSKIVELHGGQLGLVTLPSVIQGANGEEIKLKTEIGSFNITQVEEDIDKQEVVSTSSAFHEESDSVSFSTVQTSTTYTTTENYTFQNFN